MPIKKAKNRLKIRGRKTKVTPEDILQMFELGRTEEASELFLLKLEEVSKEYAADELAEGKGFDALLPLADKLGLGRKFILTLIEYGGKIEEDACRD